MQSRLTACLRQHIQERQCTTNSREETLRSHTCKEIRLVKSSLKLHQILINQSFLIFSMISMFLIAYALQTGSITFEMSLAKPQP
jgi:hypothetical protein